MTTTLVDLSNKYLTKTLDFSSNKGDRATVSTEIVHDIYIVNGNIKLFYIKVEDKYLRHTQFEEETVKLVDKPDDNCLFMRDHSVSGNFYYTVKNKGILTSAFNKLTIQSSNYNSDFSLVELIELTEDLIITDVSDKTRNVLDKLAEIVHSSPHERISNLEELDEDFKLILEDSSMHEALKKYYKNQEYHCTTYSSNTLNKGVDKMFFHCDYPYHNLSNGQFIQYKNTLLGVQVIITLDDFTEENGATYYVEGSSSFNKNPTSEDVNECLRKGIIKRALCKKYKMIVYPGTLWHSQGINYTDNKRSALLLNFSPMFVDKKQ